jgi:16S rRNA (cytidine1402-2'-O)-methyltransferase
MESGTLYIVATPIGNLADLTLRAADVLKSVDVVAAEDTRRTRKLLTHLGIGKRLVSYREDNREKAAREIISSIQALQSIALVTDAGTPGLSDPGHYLVQKALESNIRVVPVPGVSALAAALSVSGLPLDRFVFEGFLPPRQASRRNRLLELSGTGYPMIIYESPRRISATLSDILDVLGDRNIVVAREMTKIHEEYLRGPASKIMANLQARDLKGEITLLVEGGQPPSISMELDGAVKAMRKEGLSAKRTAAILGDLTGESKQAIYRMAAEIEPGTGRREDGEKRRKGGKVKI